jgi:hypothetical protein
MIGIPTTRASTKVRPVPVAWAAPFRLVPVVRRVLVEWPAMVEVVEVVEVVE